MQRHEIRAAGLIVFILTKYAFSSQIAELNGSWTTTITVAGPILVSLFVFSICGVVRPWRNAASDQLGEAVNTALPACEDRMVVHAQRPHLPAPVPRVPGQGSARRRRRARHR
jgi:hypothetical protein